MSMEGVENVELHAGHHEVVQWLGLTFNLDTLICYMGYYGYCNTDNSTSHPWDERVVPVGLQNIVESILKA